MPTNRDVVTSYLDALATGRTGLPAARSLLADDLEYHDPLMAAAGADELIDRLGEVDTAGAPIEILEIVAGGDAVAVLTTFALPSGVPLHFTQWFWVIDGKITRSRVIYDPRPFLEMQSTADHGERDAGEA